jgi:hypothetical protein
MMAAVARTQEGSALAQVDIPVIRLNDLREFERMLQGC